MRIVREPWNRTWVPFLWCRFAYAIVGGCFFTGWHEFVLSSRAPAEDK